MLDLTKVGNKIYDCRIRNAMNQEELASRLAVSRQAVSRWELGISAPTVDNLIELMKIFQVSLEELLCLDEEPVVDKRDIFKGYPRAPIVRRLCRGELNVRLWEVFDQLTYNERWQVLKYKKAHCEPIRRELYLVLTQEERHFVGSFLNTDTKAACRF